MVVSANIALTLKIDESTYDITLSLAGGAPSNEAPFIFDVVQNTGTGDDVVKDALLLLAIGDVSDTDTNIDVKLSPPASTLQDNTNGTVQSAAVEVTSGAEFDGKKFAAAG